MSDDERIARLEAEMLIQRQRHESDLDLRARFRAVMESRLDQLEGRLVHLENDLTARAEFRARVDGRLTQLEEGTRGIVDTLEGARDAFAVLGNIGRAARKVARWVLPFVALGGSIFAAVSAWRDMHKW